jgi:hypothetical protein
MTTRRSFVASALALAFGTARAHGADEAPAADPAWLRLLPPGWDPQHFVDELGLEAMGDMDPEAQEALQKLRAIWDAAPPNPLVAGEQVTLAGFMVPVQPRAPQIDAFVLLPYFGACIHAPAPPANQMVRVVPATPIPATARGNSAVIVTGVLRLESSPSNLGVVAYGIREAKVEARRA